MTRTIAIGDIHGCFTALKTLVGKITPDSSDTIITLGDVVDRGDRSRDVIDFLIELKSRCQLVPILGNHEEMMLEVLKGASPNLWVQHGGASTLDSYGFCGDLDVIPNAHLNFLMSFQDYFETEHSIFTHANCDPSKPMSQQRRKYLRWLSLKDSVPNPHRSGKHLVVGHTANRQGEIFQLPHLTCLDTCCYGGGWLTALDVGSGQYWQANESGQTQEGNLIGTFTHSIAS